MFFVERVLDESVSILFFSLCGSFIDSLQFAVDQKSVYFVFPCLHFLFLLYLEEKKLIHFQVSYFEA
jgi:hypothetical protein